MYVLQRHAQVWRPWTHEADLRQSAVHGGEWTWCQSSVTVIGTRDACTELGKERKERERVSGENGPRKREGKSEW